MPETTEKTALIDVRCPGARAKFETWIKERGGVKRWVNVNLSNPGAGDMFSPALETDGKEYGKPTWSVELAETIYDISRFRFAKGEYEVDRMKIALAPLSSFQLKLTTSSSNKLRALCGKYPDCSYHFEELEAVIMRPIWEGEEYVANWSKRGFISEEHTIKKLLEQQKKLRQERFRCEAFGDEAGVSFIDLQAAFVITKLVRLKEEKR